MYAKVCDICKDVITRGNDEVLNGDKVLIHITAETEQKVQHFDICYNCFQKRFDGDFLQISVDRQILAEMDGKYNKEIPPQYMDGYSYKNEKEEN